MRKALFCVGSVSGSVRTVRGTTTTVIGKEQKLTEALLHWGAKWLIGILSSVGSLYPIINPWIIMFEKARGEGDLNQTGGDDAEERPTLAVAQTGQPDSRRAATLYHPKHA
jgi:hypothetical protein